MILAHRTPVSIRPSIPAIRHMLLANRKSNCRHLFTLMSRNAQHALTLMPHAADRTAKLKMATHAVTILATAFALLAGGSAIASTKASLDVPMIVTQVPARNPAPPSAWDAKDLVRGDWFDGARLVIVSPDGQVRVLSGDFQSACDPNVSFDGQRVLFAGRKERNARWRIWEMGIDGQGLRPVSPEDLDARSPIYVSTLFTLNSPQPWFTTVFVGRESSLNELGRPSASSLYDITLDGKELRRLTYNPNRNFDPFQMWDGRLIYAAERYPNEGVPTGGRVGLYAIHMEGADMEFYGGELGQRIQRMPCATAGGLVIFVESVQPSWDGAGQLACVEQRRPHFTYRALTQDTAQVFLYPSPLQGNQVLVSRRSANGKGTCGVFRFDADTGRAEPVFDSPDFHDVQAVLAKSRNRPDGHSTVVTTADNFGTLYGLDCYTTDAARTGHLQPGEVKSVRLIEGVASTPGAPTSPVSPAISRRLIGEAPVEADGSYNLFVPADTPLLLQTVDENGLALGTCGWIWVKPQEKRGCIGCHEDPERVPENKFVLALHHDSRPLLTPAAERRVVTFLHDVAPILQRSLATGLLDPRNQPLHFSLTTPAGLQEAYQTLTRGPNPLVEPGRARTSRLIWQLVGRNTSRPWDSTAQTKVAPPAAASPRLSADELRTLILWIDLGAVYDAPATPAPSAKETAGK